MNGQTVAALYPLALLEGEGMGTAYEYSAKLKLFNRVLTQPINRVLVGGLPEAYGVDLAVTMLAARYGSHVVVADDRPEARQAFDDALHSPLLESRLGEATFELRPLETLAAPALVDDEPFDLWVTTTALQRMSAEDLDVYLALLRTKARQAVLMVPNENHNAHQTLTGLRGFFLPDLVACCERAGLRVHDQGCLDMPPFPPGLTRSDEAKAQATESIIERMAMWVLEWAARVERFWPWIIRRRYSHILYVVVTP